MRYSNEPRNRVSMKGYGSFIKYIGKNIGKDIYKNLSCKYR